MRNVQLTVCEQPGVFQFYDMEGDHIKPWRESGKGTAANCQEYTVTAIDESGSLDATEKTVGRCSRPRRARTCPTGQRVRQHHRPHPRCARSGAPAGTRNQEPDQTGWRTDTICHGTHGAGVIAGTYKANPHLIGAAVLLAAHHPAFRAAQFRDALWVDRVAAAALLPYVNDA